MSDELPYFKFHVSKWISGKITLEKFDVQGLFITICALYWQRSGKLTLTEAKRRLTGAKPKAFNSLIENGLIIVKSDNISISFLDDQLDDRKKQHETNRANGLLGGRPKKPTPFISLTEPKGIREDKIREDKSVLRTLGTGDRFIICEATRVQGSDGLNDFFQAHKSVLNQPQLASKFLNRNNGKPFNDFRHLWQAYNKFLSDL